MSRDETVKSIEAALEHDPEINVHRHPVHVEHRDGIRLAGTVGDIRAKRRAARLARHAGSGETVVDALTVEIGVERGERELRQAVVETLKQEPAFAETLVVEGDAVPGDVDGDAIAIAADGGRVALHGCVGTVSRRWFAEVLAWWVPGVADVVNGLGVGEPEADRDGELADAVRITLEKDPSVPGRQLDVTVRDGVIRLSGAVDSEEQRRLALLDCWYIPEVAGVEDGLAVRTP
jgi:osmotically-inducible protein OsmY